MADIEKPEFVVNEHLIYLDELRELGAVNMFGAAPYLKVFWPELTKEQTQKVLVYWMQTFSERHKEEGCG